MSKELTLFGENKQLPAFLEDAFGDEDTNLVVAESVPSLSFRGKEFRIKLDGEEHLITRTIDGETYPVPSIQVIVLDVNPHRSRTYYEGAYVSGENRAPDCWSDDSKKPNKEVDSPIANTCAACPMSQKGSRISDAGKEVSACTMNRKLAVVPSNKIDMEPLLLKVPQTSLWDKDNKENEAQGFFAWEQYMTFLKARGVPHTATVVTKIKFDNTEYPKLLFSAVKWVNEEDAPKIKELSYSESVSALISRPIHDSDNDDESDQEDKKPVKKMAKKTPEVEPEDESEDAPEDEPEVPKKVTRKRNVKPKAKPEPTPADDDADWGDDEPAPTKKVAATGKGKPVKRSKPAEVPEDTKGDITGIDDLAATWDDIPN